MVSGLCHWVLALWLTVQWWRHACFSPHHGQAWEWQCLTKHQGMNGGHVINGGSGEWHGRWKRVVWLERDLCKIRMLCSEAWHLIPESISPALFSLVGNGRLNTGWSDTASCPAGAYAVLPDTAASFGVCLPGFRGCAAGHWLPSEQGWIVNRPCFVTLGREHCLSDPAVAPGKFFLSSLRDSEVGSVNFMATWGDWCTWDGSVVYLPTVLWSHSGFNNRVADVGLQQLVLKIENAHSLWLLRSV